MATAEKVFPKVTGDPYHASELNTLQIVNVEAGENLTAGNVGYIKKNDGKAYKSDTGTADDIRADGIVLDTVTSGNTAYLQIGGNYVTSSLTAGEVYYLGAAGAVSTTRSAIEIGVATSTTNLFVNIKQDDSDPIGTIKHVMANIAGVPANNISAFWMLMDGTTISDTESPLNGRTIRDVNGNNEFIRSGDTSGGTGGSDTNIHKWFDNSANASFDSGGNSFGMQTKKDGSAANNVWELGGETSDLYTDSQDNQPPFLTGVAILKYK